jgi:ribose 5-phosphate isomerase B
MIFVGADHAGFELKNKIKKYLEAKHEVTDCGTDSEESCDYPDLSCAVVEGIRSKPNSLGILICGTGLGISMAANKHHGIRAAAVSEPMAAEMSRKHNDAQILCLGSRVIDEAKAIKCIEAFLGANFEKDHPRHQRRIDKLTEIEKKECQ